MYDDTTYTLSLVDVMPSYNLTFLAYVNDIGKNTESHIRLCADDCVTYRKILTKGDTLKL